MRERAELLGGTIEFARPGRRRDPRAAGAFRVNGSGEPNGDITVLLVDDHALVRKGFRRLLEDDPGIRIVGEASNGAEAVRVPHS